MIFLILVIETVLIYLYWSYNKKLKKLMGTGRMTDISITANYKKALEFIIFIIPIVFILVKIDWI